MFRKKPKFDGNADLEVTIALDAGEFLQKDITYLEGTVPEDTKDPVYFEMGDDKYGHVKAEKIGTLGKHWEVTGQSRHLEGVSFNLPNMKVDEAVPQTAKALAILHADSHSIGEQIARKHNFDSEQVVSASIETSMGSYDVMDNEPG